MRFGLPSISRLSKLPQLSSEHPVRLHHCPSCGYELAHLDGPGACPECGSRYDEQSFSIPGLRPTRYPWTFLLFFIPMLAISWLKALVEDVRAGRGGELHTDIVAIFGLAVLVTGVLVWVRWRYRPRPFWILFQPEGVSFNAGKGWGGVTSLRDIQRVHLAPIDAQSQGDRRRWRLNLIKNRSLAEQVTPRRPPIAASHDFDIVFLATDSQVDAVRNAIESRFNDAWGGRVLHAAISSDCTDGEET